MFYAHTFCLNFYCNFNIFLLSLADRNGCDHPRVSGRDPEPLPIRCTADSVLRAGVLYICCIVDGGDVVVLEEQRDKNGFPVGYGQL